MVPGMDAPRDAYPLTPSEDVHAIRAARKRWGLTSMDDFYDEDEPRGRRLLFDQGPGLDPDWLSEAEAHEDIQALIEADQARWGDDPWGAWR